MGRTLKDDLADDLPVFLNPGEFAERATYVTACGLSTALVVTVLRRGRSQRDEPQETIEELTLETFCRIAEIPAPAEGDILILEGDPQVTWSFQSIVDRDLAAQTLAWVDRNPIGLTKRY